jgi:non-heme chloroperoxidase
VDTIASQDGTPIYYKDWGRGPVVTFSHGWPLNADAWDGQMLLRVQNGFRVIAHDRRGHGRSRQASSGNDMNGYADDLAAVIETLDLRNVTLVGHSTEVARSYVTSATQRGESRSDGRRATSVAENRRQPGSLPLEVCDSIQAGLRRHCLLRRCGRRIRRTALIGESCKAFPRL